MAANLVCLNTILEIVVGSDATELKIAGFILCNCALIWQSGVKTDVKTGSAEHTLVLWFTYSQLYYYYISDMVKPNEKKTF